MHSNVRLSEPPVSQFVEGGVAESASDTTVDVVNPSNGEKLPSIPAGCEKDVDRAVISARRSFEDGRWSEAQPSFRKRIIHRLADLIEAQTAVFDALDAEEMGKPVGERLFDAATAASLTRFCAEAIDKVSGDVYGSDKSSLVIQRHVPRGVVAAVVPWNFPTFNAVLKVAPALAAGNCVVLKPSELSSRSALKLAHLAVQAGLPPGVLNVVPGLGDTVGRALALHQNVDMVTFTGSTEVGKKMLQFSGQSNMKVVHAECGGKSPQIVFADGVDLDAASESISRFLLTNQGQICSVGSRVLVQRDIEAELLERIGSHMRQAVIGDARNPTTTFGPLASAKQFARVMQYIQTADATLVMGGRKILQESGGFFVEPTLFRVTSASARIAQEEIFGPVLSVIPFKDEAEAIRIANDTMYGLIAYVWTSNLSTAMRMAKSIRSSVMVNAVKPQGEGAGHAVAIEPARQSGIGVEGGVAGLERYFRRQLVWFNHA